MKTKPCITTDSFNTITAISANLIGTLHTDNTIDAKGICWNTGGFPTVTDDISYQLGTEGTFQIKATLLGYQNQTYYYRAFLSGYVDGALSNTTYGDQLSFTTP